MLALADLKPYEEVLAQGALNAAIAYQYGHNHNVFFQGEFYGNEDFAREFHQLFFGILGENDHEYHELVSIKNTAKALTGMQASWHPDEEGGPDVEIAFVPGYHHTDPLEILLDHLGTNGKGEDRESGPSGNSRSGKSPKPACYDCGEPG